MPETTPSVTPGPAHDPPPLFPRSLERLTSNKDWRKTWTRIVAGQFVDSPYSSVLFYEQSTGYAEFYESDGRGGISFRKSYSDWRKTWTHIISGAFYGNTATGLLLYDQQAGFAAIYNTDGKGGLTGPVHEYPGWRKSWTHITTIRIPGSDRSGVVLYDQAAGHGEIHSCDETGNLKLILQSDGWRKTWTQLVGDFFSGTGLLFYEGSTSYGEIYSLFGDTKTGFSFGVPTVMSGLPPATDIVPGNFGSADTSFLFYDRPSGRAAFIFYWAQPDAQTIGNITLGSDTYSDWRTTWDIIVPGKFWVADPEYVKFQDGFTCLLFYDRANGYGEVYLHEPFDSIHVESLEGYVSSGSVLPGENICFYVNSRVGPYTINIYRQDVDTVFMATVENVQNFPQPFPIGRLDYRDGPAWPPVASLTIPHDWPSGLYLAHVATTDSTPGPAGVPASVGSGNPTATMDIPFVVRAANPGQRSKILLYVPDTTYEAYNFWGGRCLYGFVSQYAAVWNYGATTESPDNAQGPRAFRVAFARPYRDEIGLAKWQHWEVPLIRWLARQGIAVEMCTATDLHKDQANHTDLLSNYRLVISVGHDEYWSKEMRDNVEGFTAAGGNVAFFSGNVCWWQIRFDLHTQRQICYKDVRFDPYNPAHSDIVTVNWYDKPVCRAETSLTGVSYYGGIPSGAKSEESYTVSQPKHWVFKDTGVVAGTVFGNYTQSEADRYQPPQGNKCLPSSPANFERLADMLVIDKAGNTIKGLTTGTMGIFTNQKGQVFTAGVVDWSLNLSQDGSWVLFDQITKNVIVRLGLS